MNCRRRQSARARQLPLSLSLPPLFLCEPCFGDSQLPTLLCLRREKYHSLAPMYYRGAAAAVVVYDITRKKSFATLKRWVSELRTHGPAGMVLSVAGNKSDLNDLREVKRDTAEAYADNINAIFGETSAKEDTNVTSMFEEIARRLAPEDGNGGGDGFGDGAAGGIGGSGGGGGVRLGERGQRGQDGASCC